jgi:diguanylate cyclase (GGDEF)-like protein
MPRTTDATDPGYWEGPALYLLGLISPLLAAGVGLVALLGWIAGLPLLSTFATGRVPMAPSTALLFVLFGTAAFRHARMPQSKGARRTSLAIGLSVTAVALLLLVLSSLGISPAAEHLGIPIAGTAGGAVIGHMSPLTASCFAFAGFSFLAQCSSTFGRRWRANAAIALAFLVVMASIVLIIAYLRESPVLYGSGIIPPALPTSLAFLMLGTALLAAAVQRAWPPETAAALDNSTRSMSHSPSNEGWPEPLDGSQGALAWQQPAPPAAISLISRPASIDKNLFRDFSVEKHFWLLAFGWTFVVVVLFFWAYYGQHNIMLEEARQRARTAYEKDVAYRRWSSLRGGVYAAVNQHTQPNPYLADIPERDIRTPSGRLLTLINPAYMTRQVHEAAYLENGDNLGHITSLKPLRPENGPDPWEKAALEAFERGDTEVHAVQLVNNQPSMRIMRPLKTEASCLKCHAVQGYKVGDIRGGLSVSVPLSAAQTAVAHQAWVLLGQSGLLWFLGIGGLWGANRRLGIQIVRREQVEEQLHESNRHLAQLNQELHHTSFHDKLTGLPNRALFCDRLQQAILRSQRLKDYHFAVLFLDFDRFKTINDSLGHNIGDLLLQEIAQRLHATVRCGDSLGRQVHGHITARIGGDEFVVFLDGLANPDDAKVVAERLLGAFSQPFRPGEHEVYSTASIGIATSNITTGNANEMLRDADTAMYEAKLTGKGQYVVFDVSMRQRVQNRLTLELDLRKALDGGELFLVYQPIVSLQTGQIESFEALVRWKHPERGIISPGEFIPIAEDTGLILPIGEWVMREACGQFTRWRQCMGDAAPRSISVNLSRKQLMLPDLPETIQRILDQTGMAPECLHLEVTESAVMKDVAAAAGVLHAIKAIGVKLDMDDFGTGYSSLACLHQFPIDVLKIDRSFIANIDRGRDYAALVHAVTQLARNLNICVVAEGIETMDQVLILQSLECEFGQGYLFSKPLTADRVVEFKVQTYLLPKGNETGTQLVIN